MKIFFGCHSTQFEAVLVEKFIECLGIYLIGLLVAFRTGEARRLKVPKKIADLNPKLVLYLMETKNLIPLLL